MNKTVAVLTCIKIAFFCCILCADGQKIQHKFGVLTEELETLRNLMESENIDNCDMESTSVYWMPIWRVLEHSVRLHLVNPISSGSFPAGRAT